MSKRDEPAPRDLAGHWRRNLFMFPLEVVRAALESAVTQRGIALLFFIVAIVVTTAGWLRPPLSPDLRAHHIPLQIGNSHWTDPQSMLAVPRHARLDSVGGVLLAFLAVGGAIALVWPRRLQIIAGMLLCLSIVANAVLCLDYPALIDRMDSEAEQRQQIAQVLVALDANSIANGGEPRVYLALDTIPLLRGYHYLLYSPWLVGWAGLGLLVSARGPIGRRVMRLGLWSVCGAALAAAICLSPLRAEYHWTSAVRSESRGEWAAARRSLDKAVTCCPEFERLWRTRRLVGQLDFRQGYSSRARQLWQIDQWMRNNEYAKAISMMDRIVGSPQGNLDLDRFASRVFTQVGLSYWGEGRWTAAGDMWRKATTLDPERWNSRFFLGTVLARMDRSHPELVDAEFSPLLTHMADRVLRADILASLGDAYFDAGQMEIARQHYEESLRAFELPKDINYRARRGLVGM